MTFAFTITEVDKALLIKAPYAALDGKLTILIKQRVFFDEEGLSLLELAIHIADWLNKVRANDLIDFDYSADDYQENPVLHLTRIGGHRYAITSSWVITPADNALDLEEIIYCFESFLLELNTAVQQAYGIAFSDMRILGQVFRNN